MSSMSHHNRAFGQQFGSRDMGFGHNFSFNFEAVDDVFVITSTQIRQVRWPHQFGRRNMGFYPNGRQNFPLYSQAIDDVVVISPTQMRQIKEEPKFSAFIGVENVWMGSLLHNQLQYLHLY